MAKIFEKIVAFKTLSGCYFFIAFIIFSKNNWFSGAISCPYEQTNFNHFK